MQNVEFLNYVSTPEEKFMGVATTRHVLADGGKIVLRWKVVPKKEGDGYFIAPASLKTGESESGYVESHMLDSRSDDEMVKAFIRENVNCSLARCGSVQASKPSSQVFSPSDSAQGSGAHANAPEEEVPF